MTSGSCPVSFGSMIMSCTRPVMTRISAVATRPAPSAVRTSRWETIPLSVPAIIARAWDCWCGGKKSMIRLIDSDASTVWSVESTRWPVSAALSAVWTVSSSRISPTRMTSGSWRSTRRSARLNDAVSCPTSRWLTIELRSGWRNSIGSSIVTMCLCIVRFMWSIIAASVVDLPQPADDRRQRELLDRLDVDRDRAQHERDESLLAERVDAEPRQALERVREVDLVLGLELGQLVGVVEHLVQDALGVLRGEALGPDDRLELAVQADERVRGNLEMEVEIGR